MKIIQINFEKGVADQDISIAPQTVAALHTVNVDKLRSGISHFVFQKKDGTTREAFGTLKLDIMPASYTTNPDYYDKGVARSSATSQSYYDLIAQDWRAYSIENLLTVL